MFHRSSGILELNQRELLGLGSVKILSKLCLSMGPAAWMYLEWKATPELLTPLANIPSSVSCWTNLAIESTGPEI